MFRARDGRIVWGGITNPLWEVPGVRKFQFIQKSYDLVVVRIVKDEQLLDEPRRRVQEVIRVALGDHVEVRFEYPSDIPVHESGKHRYQICELSPHLRTAAHTEALRK